MIGGIPWTGRASCSTPRRRNESRLDRIVGRCVKVLTTAGRGGSGLRSGMRIPPSRRRSPITDRMVQACRDSAQRSGAWEFLEGATWRIKHDPASNCRCSETSLTAADRVRVSTRPRRRQRIFFAREPRNLSAAARFYCDTDHDGAHGALADAAMTLRVIVGQLGRYSDLPRSVAELHELFCAGIDQDMDPEGRIRLINGEPTINFGRHRGRSLRAISPKTGVWLELKEISRFRKRSWRKFGRRQNEPAPKAQAPIPNDHGSVSASSEPPSFRGGRRPVMPCHHEERATRDLSLIGARSLATLGMTLSGHFSRRNSKRISCRGRRNGCPVITRSEATGIYR